MDHTKKITLESIRYYEGNIKEYQKMYDRNQRIIDNPNVSPKTKEGFQALNDVIKKEMESSQEEIKRLIS